MAHEVVFSLNLTPIEERIIDLIIQGRSNYFIGGMLHMTPNATKTAIYRIYNKLGLNDRGELKLWWLESQVSMLTKHVAELEEQNRTLIMQRDQWKSWSLRML